MGDRLYYVYILASRSRTLYTGVTGDLSRRVYQHKEKAHKGFTSRYYVTRLVYYAVFGDPRLAIAREKQIKAWRRSKKVALINSVNPKWLDISEQLFRPAVQGRG